MAVILIDTNRFAYKGTWQVRLDFFPVFGSAEGLRPGSSKQPLPPSIRLSLSSPHSGQEPSKEFLLPVSISEA